MTSRSMLHHSHSRQPVLALLLLALGLAVLSACGSPAPTGAPSATVPRRTTTAGLTIIEPDEAYYQFGAVLPVQAPVEFWRYDPHNVAQYSTQLCREGRTADLLAQLAYVEDDASVGQSWARFVELFGPDLERYAGCSIGLRFVGVRQNDKISVWYYGLLDEQGQPLDDSSWITVHRSKLDGRCALAGVYVNQFGEQAVYMPEDLITSR